MSGIKGRSARRFAKLFVASAAVLSVTAACGGSSDSASGDGGIPSSVKVVGIEPLTGPAAFAGLAAQKGYDLAIKQINDQGFLGSGKKIESSWKDTKGDAATAASEMTAAIADKSVAATFGSVSSQEAVAQSPLAQKAGLPVIYTQAGSDGVVIGDYTYRATPLMSSYYPIMKKYIEDNGWESIGIIYTNISPTLDEIGTKTLPDLAEETGMEVTKSVETTAATQDYSSAIKQVLDTDPDVVSILEIGAANPTAMTQLRQAGYTGKVLGNSGASAGNLEPAGADGAGMAWPVDFDASQDAPSSQQFVKDYTAEYGEAPLNYAAEAYDAAWFLARSIKEAGNASRDGIKDGMKTESGKTSDGALGSDLAWKDGTIEVPGVVVEWDGTQTQLLYAADGS